MAINFDTRIVERRFLNSIKHHIQGWKDKIAKDFSIENYEAELAALKGDPVYRKFAFDTPEYVLIRLIGRMSISIGRRLGEIYDKLPRYVASARFGINADAVAEKFNGLELDIGLRFSLLESEDDVRAIQKLVDPFIGEIPNVNGLGIEIRYNFNPNDSARLRKDVDMCGYLQESGLVPIYLIYSSISPRNDAISRLTRAGWIFMQGDQAASFTNSLFGVDFLGLLERPDIKEEIHNEIRSLLKEIFTSDAFKQI